MVIVMYVSRQCLVLEINFKSYAESCPLYCILENIGELMAGCQSFAVKFMESSISVILFVVHVIQVGQCGGDGLC